MKAIKYQIKVCDTVLDSLHGFFYNINEIYVPKLKIVFNEKGGIFKINNDNCLRISKENIFNVENIEVKKSDVLSLINFLKYKNKYNKIISKYFSNIKENE